MEADLSIRASELAEVTVGQLEKLSDEELFAYMKAGYHDALAIVFRRYQKMVFRIARGILKDAGEAEDLMQVVFLELFQAVGKFDPSKGSSKGWIIRYAYHRSLNRKKYLKARAFYGQEEIENGNGRGIQVAATPVVTLGLKEQEARRLIQQSLATLNEAQRKTLTLAFFEGLSMEEIAVRQKESLVNVRHHYYRGLQKLRSFFYGAQSSNGNSDRRNKE
jgi:RNA polymerase sigma-70 factor (ECF subfamily)